MLSNWSAGEDSECPLDSKEIKPVNPKENQPWIFIGRTDAKAEALMLWPPGAKSWLIGKDPDAGKDWGQKEKRATEDEMFGWITDSMDMSLSKLWEIVKDRKVWRAAVHAVAKSWTQLSDWTTTMHYSKALYWVLEIPGRCILLSQRSQNPMKGDIGIDIRSTPESKDTWC